MFFTPEQEPHVNKLIKWKHERITLEGYIPTFVTTRTLNDLGIDPLQLIEASDGTGRLMGINIVESTPGMVQ